jgi:signal transduction histidine kinase/ActR/RegA family two-component response regulator
MSRIKLLLVLISGCLVAASISLAVLITQRQETLRQVSRYNTSWLASQAVAEFTRLEQRISAFGQPGSGVDKDEIELRFDILLNRIRLLGDGEFQDFVRRDGERRDIVERLSAAVAQAEPLIQHIDMPGIPNRLLDLLTPLDRDLALMASAANRYGAERVSEDQHELSRLHLTFSALSGGLAVFGFGLILVLGRQNKFLERARADLSQQNTRFDVAINNMPHGLAMFDAEARLIVSNRRLPLVLGLAEATPMAGLTLGEMADRTETEGRSAKAKLFRDLAAALSQDSADSILHALPDGRTLALSRSVMAEGGFVCIFEDVTARIEAQTRREQLEEQLLQAQKMEAVGQLTGGIAHDFNNLLTVILGNAEVLVEDQPDSAGTRELARMILEAAEQGADLTQKLLAFGRRQSLKTEHLKLGDAVSGMTPLLRRAIGEHIDLRTEFTGAGAYALTDKALLESAILNLVVNARDAMPQGGTLTIKTGERQAAKGERNLTLGTPVVYLTVSDTGTGMPPEVLARAFEPFFTTKEVGKGSGLGLSMVYGFAEQSGGHVHINSKVGQGTSITVVLPAAQTQASEAEPVDEQKPAARGRERVLVVEDEPHVLQYVSSQLRRLGYQVTAASTGAEAIMLLQHRSRFDIIFTDVVLPRGMSGIEVARQARSIDPNLKVLLTSGYPEEVFEQHGRPDEHTRLLRKPFKSKDLAAALRETLDSNVRPLRPRALAS